MITGDWVAMVEQAEDCNILLRALPILTGYSLRMTCSLDFLISDKLLLVILILSSFYKYLLVRLQIHCSRVRVKQLYGVYP